MSQRICNSSEAASQIVAIAQILTRSGWLPATSGNLSVLIQREPMQMAVTASGVDKEFLSLDDILVVNEACEVLDADLVRKPSFETQIHSFIYQNTSAGCVLHVHTVFNNLVGEWANENSFLEIQSLELIKALGIWSEDASIQIPVIDNYADIEELVGEIATRFQNHPPKIPCVLIRAHGIYVWGTDWLEAKKHLQAFEFMFEYLVYAQGQKPRPVTRFGGRSK